MLILFFLRSGKFIDLSHRPISAHRSTSDNGGLVVQKSFLLRSDLQRRVDKTHNRLGFYCSANRQWFPFLRQSCPCETWSLRIGNDFCYCLQVLCLPHIHNIQLSIWKNMLFCDHPTLTLISKHFLWTHSKTTMATFIPWCYVAFQLILLPHWIINAYQIQWSYT